ncbi:PLP-dependent aminotransferase family protein [Paraburkholderia hayleyella]|uniref:MocR-like pyridoxine biosynthesis transcription factor PdxR n=1 Tax=Paraburkholderia hayleyella TaxID=2152889 RepID=UPI0012917750|nr:PLP-dependent aminotransferase family protein [Paraburkholderia hayleyella]
MEAILLSDLILPQLTPDSGESLQNQIAQCIQRCVLDGLLKVGHRMPSTRALASQLKVSRITVLRVYERLTSEGYLSASVGSGTYVADTFAQRGPRERVAPAATGISRRGAQIVSSTQGLVQLEGAFVPGVADISQFPFHVWQRLQNRYLRKEFNMLTGYGAGGGYMPLRRALASYLRISRGVQCEPEQVIITAGTHQSLDLCARMLTDHGDTAATEDPCHWGIPTVMRAAGLNLLTCKLDSEGVVLDEAALAATPKLLVTTPSHQYPSGAVMSLQRRTELLHLAHERDFWILEDDYDSEFHYDERPLPSLQGLDTHGRVLYMGTFSKVLYPGLRMSYVVVPPALAEAFATSLAQLFRPGQITTHAAMTDFITSGHFSTHVRTMRGVYAERRAALLDSFARHLEGAAVLSGGRAGLHLQCHFDPALDVPALVAAGAAVKLSLRELQYYQIEPGQPNGLVLGYGGVPTSQIDEKVALLAQCHQQLHR